MWYAARCYIWWKFEVRDQIFLQSDHLIFGIHAQSSQKTLNEILCLLFALHFAAVPLRHCIFSLEMTENKRPLLISRAYIIRSLQDAVVAAWLIATTTMDIFYNGRGGRHERLEIHLLPRETQSNPVGWEEDLALFFLIFHRKLISRVSPSGRRALDSPPLSLHWFCLLIFLKHFPAAQFSASILLRPTLHLYYKIFPQFSRAVFSWSRIHSSHFNSRLFNGNKS